MNQCSISKKSWSVANAQQQYTSASEYERELASIWANEWIFVCRRNSLRVPGDFLALDLIGRPIFLWVQSDGRVQAFANYCVHRYTKLAVGSGCSKVLTCPFHGWQYDVNGALLSRPFAANLPVDRAALERLDTAEWMGAIFVRFGHCDGAHFVPPSKLESALAELGVFALEDVFEDNLMASGNWKLHVETFTESYHLSFVHRRSIGRLAPTRLATPQESNISDNYSLHYNDFISPPPVLNSKAALRHPGRAAVAALFPNYLISPSQDLLWWIGVFPINSVSSFLRWGIAVSPELRASVGVEGLDQIRKEVTLALQEDINIIDRVQAGVAYGSSEHGMLHPIYESTLETFASYLQRRMSLGVVDSP